jgi:DNA-binding transcriptional ArsR family regulator
MAVTFGLPSERPLDLVGFAWSPLFEAVLSLPVVIHPKRTPMHLPWARRCRELPDDLVNEIRALAGAFDGCVSGIFEVGLAGDSPTFEDELAAFMALDDHLVAYGVSSALCELGPSGGDVRERVDDAAYRSAVISAAGAVGEPRAELARQTFEEPGAVQSRLAGMLERYWEAAFRDEWERVLPRIEAEVTDGARALVTRGVPGLVDELLPEGRWDELTSSIVVDRAHHHRCDVAARGGMQFVPTVYGWPRVLIETDEPWPVLVVHPLRDMRQPEVPHASDHEVAEGLRALGDETRLQITRMVAEQPRSTKELAELLRLSDSAVSRHLKILDAAGVVTGERDGYFVLYRLRPERIGQLGGALRRTLGLAHGRSGNVPALPVTPTLPVPRRQGRMF